MAMIEKYTLQMVEIALISQQLDAIASQRVRPECANFDLPVISARLTSDRNPAVFQDMPVSAHLAGGTVCKTKWRERCPRASRLFWQLASLLSWQPVPANLKKSSTWKSRSCLNRRPRSTKRRPGRAFGLAPLTAAARGPLFRRAPC